MYVPTGWGLAGGGGRGSPRKVPMKLLTKPASSKSTVGFALSTEHLWTVLCYLCMAQMSHEGLALPVHDSVDLCICWVKEK